MINIQNESSLHNTLKLYYANRNSGLTEVEKEGHIYDIVGKDGQIIEIQTKNLSALENKIKDTLEKKYKITVVYPLVITNRIYLTDEEGKLVSKRKSPKKGNIYDIFDELTKIYPYLLHKNFTLEVVHIDMIEHRIKTSDAVQSKNKKRRYKKDWIKVNKRLEKIIRTDVFKTRKDYLSFLPSSLPESFCAKDLSKYLKAAPSLPARISTKAHLIIWVLVRMNLIVQTEVKNKSRYYKINR